MRKKGICKREKVLITAGATWVRIDHVRCLTNLARGLTGYRLARYFAQRGYQVTLLLGPTEFEPISSKNLMLRRFRYYRDLEKILRRELSRKRYAIIIHSAAVSDYAPRRIYSGKISSKKELLLKLTPLPKLLPMIRRHAPAAVLVQFKLENTANKKDLYGAALQSLRRNKTDFVVANSLKDIENGDYTRYIMDATGNRIVAFGGELPRKLLRVIQERMRS